MLSLASFILIGLLAENQSTFSLISNRPNTIIGLCLAFISVGVFLIYDRKHVANHVFNRIKNDKKDSFKLDEIISDSTNQKYSKSLWLFFIVLFGFLYGCIFYRESTPLEVAQVLAGIVQYSPESLIYKQYTELWTILNHIFAIFLYMGLSEQILCIMWGGIETAISFCGLVLITSFFTKDIRYAFSLILIMIFAKLYFKDGMNYPIYIFNGGHSSASMALNTSILLLGLHLNNFKKSFAIILGLLPAIHLIVGSWFTLIIMITIFIDNKRRFKIDKQIAFCYFFGIILSVFSYIINYGLFVQKQGSIDFLKAHAIMIEYMQIGWDMHRGLPLPMVGVFTIIGGLIICIYSFYYKDKMINDKHKFLLRFYIISGILGLVLILLSRFTPLSFASLLHRIIVDRLSNINILLFPVLFISFLSLKGMKLNLWIYFFLSIFVYLVSKNNGYVFLFYGALFSDLVFRKNLNKALLFLFIYFILVALLPGLDMSFDLPIVILGLHLIYFQIGESISVSKISNFIGLCSRILFYTFDLFIMKMKRSLFTMLLFLAIILAYIDEIYDSRKFYSWENDKLYQYAKKHVTRLITPTINGIQLKTERPVLFNAETVNLIPYFPYFKNEAIKMLEELYGVDYYNPPEKHYSTLKMEWYKNLWETRTKKDWIKLFNKYKVSHLLVPLDWEIQLNFKIANNEYKLYGI